MARKASCTHLRTLFFAEKCLCIASTKFPAIIAQPSKLFVTSFRSAMSSCTENRSRKNAAESCPRRPPKQLQLGFWEPLFSYCALLGFSQRLTHHESPLEECRDSFSVCTQFPKNSGCQVQHAVSIRRMPSGDNAILCLRKASAYAI